MREVGDQVALVREHLRADRYVQLDIVAVRAVLARPQPVATARRLDPAAPLQRRQVAERGVGDEHDVATVAAVATVGAALRDELLAAEAHAAVAALAGLDGNRCAVAEHDRTVAPLLKARALRSPAPPRRPAVAR